MKKTIFGLTAALFVTAASANTPIPDVSPVSEGQHVFINIPQQHLFSGWLGFAAHALRRDELDIVAFAHVGERVVSGQDFALGGRNGVC